MAASFNVMIDYQKCQQTTELTYGGVRPQALLKAGLYNPLKLEGADWRLVLSTYV